MTTTHYHPANELHCKIVYCGPDLGGKTTNIHYLHEHIAPDGKGDLISLPSEGERTVFFDFLPLFMGKVRDREVRFHLYTLPAQVFYEASRRLILHGVDGVVFVADSQVAGMEANIESLNQLKKYLLEEAVDWSTLPTTFQFNKRDMPHVVAVPEMNALLNPRGVPYFEAVAAQGMGVFETLREISQQVIRNADFISDSSPV
jgi:hypothetical protein